MDNSRAELLPQQCLVLDGIAYLPHYQDANKYVSPGFGLTHYDTYFQMELVALGAKPVITALWPRAWGNK